MSEQVRRTGRSRAIGVVLVVATFVVVVVAAALALGVGRWSVALLVL